MWLATLATCIALTAATAEVQSGPPANASALPAPLPPGKLFFPFPLAWINRPNRPASRRKCNCWFRHDNGIHWQLYARAQPNQKQIPFRTATDGEYWFAIRTVDRAGKFHPETISAPGLRVIC